MDDLFYKNIFLYVAKINASTMAFASENHSLNALHAAFTGIFLYLLHV
jgi:hypothetical protein